jgi:hypothetical protein
MFTREEGGSWEVVPIHSIVFNGKRWDVISQTWTDYAWTPEYFEPVNMAKRGVK